MSDFQACVRSMVPGRVRFRHPILKTLSEEDLKMAHDWITSIEGVFAFEVNPRVGSALILWDSEKLSEEEFLDQLENLITTAVGMMGEGKDLTVETTPLTTVCHVASKAQQTAAKGLGNLAVFIAGGPNEEHSVQRVERMALNRTMLVALILSMGGIVTRNYAWHVAGGVTFLAFLGLHLINNRRLL